VPDWRLKAVLQRTLYRLPAGGRVNYLMQRHVTRTAVMRPAFARNKVEQCGRHWANWAAGSGGAVPDRVIEVGTGWFPFVIVGLALAGCREVVTVDRSPLLRPENVAATLRVLDEGLADGWVGERLGHVDPGRRAVLTQLARHDRVPAEELSRLGVRLVVGDAAAMPFPDASVDLFVSNNTLEHIAEPALAAMLAEFRRVGRPTARMSHFIDMSDHYSHFDASISPLNFLRFDERAWRRWDNGIVPQNRLRLSDYRRLHERAGFAIVDEELTLADESALDAIPLAPAFASRDRDDLRTTYAWVVSVPTEAR
jgi:SAM-dependent methyltransferase